MSLVYDAYKVQDKTFASDIVLYFQSTVGCFEYLTVLLYLKNSRSPNCQESKKWVSFKLPTLIGSLIGTYVQSTWS